MFKKTFITFVFTALLMVSYSCSSGSEKGYTNITPNKVKEMIFSGDKDLLILDVRTKGEYNGPDGHIKGAILIPISLIKNRLDEIKAYSNLPIIVYCAVGGRSSKVSSFLSDNGFTKVYNMIGGMTEWNRLGFKVEK